MLINEHTNRLKDTSLTGLSPNRYTVHTVLRMTSSSLIEHCLHVGLSGDVEVESS
jgi:hypothetical protein